MNLLIFGATGGTGRQLVTQALSQGHLVTAFVRNPEKLKIAHENLRVVQGDISDGDAVAQAISGQDAVLSALGVRLPVALFLVIVVAAQVAVRFASIHFPASLLISLGVPVVANLLLFTRNSVLSTGTRHIVSAMQQHRVRRFLCESSLGVGDTRGRLGLLYTLVLIPLLLRGVFADKEMQERIIRESGLDWVIVRPAALTNGPCTGNYRSGSGIGHWFFTKKICRADVADFMLKQVADDSHLRQSPSLAY